MLSVIISTLNNLPHLKLCLNSLRKYSTPETEVLVHVDGSTDGTVGWLTDQRFDYVYEEHKGIFHGLNEAASRATGEFIAHLDDDWLVSPDWDKNLLKHAKKYRVLASRLVEPKWGSFPPIMNFGKTYDTFKEEEFIAYAKRISVDKLVPWGTVGANFFSRELLWEMEGYDENYSPYGFGDTDLRFRLKVKYPEMEFLQCQSSIIYHFQAISKSKFGEEEKKEIDDRNSSYFRKKWGASLDEMHKRLGI